MSAHNDHMLATLARIGAGRECDVVLQDKAVSRLHAEVRAARGGVLVVDLDSRNGTRVNNAMIKEAFVPVEGRFVVGETTIRVIDAGRDGRLVKKSRLL